MTKQVKTVCEQCAANEVIQGALPHCSICKEQLYTLEKSYGDGYGTGAKTPVKEAYTFSEGEVYCYDAHKHANYDPVCVECGEED